MGLPEHRIDADGLLQMCAGFFVESGAEVDSASSAVGYGIVRLLFQHLDIFGESLFIESLEDQQVGLLDADFDIARIKAQGLVVMHEGHFMIATAHLTVGNLFVLLGSEDDAAFLGVGKLVEACGVRAGLGCTTGEGEDAQYGYDDGDGISHDFLLFLSRYPSSVAKMSMNRMTAGPMMAINRAGKINVTRGSSRRTGSLAAFSSARWERLVRIASE